MPTPFPEHPLRAAITAELHARTFDPLCAPARVVHIAYLCGERGSGRQRRYLQRLLGHFGQPQPSLEAIGQQYSATVADLQLRWERHTEFVTYTFSRCGPFPDDYADPFTHDLLAVLPPVWLRELPGEVVTAVLLALESRDMPQRSPEELSDLFDGNTVIGSAVAGGAGLVWSDLRIHEDGYSRVLVHDLGMTDQQAGRLVKRLLEIKAYRSMALLGLPLAQEISAPLADADRRLATAAAHMVEIDAHNGHPAQAPGVDRSPPERGLLADLTALAAEIEAIAARTTSRFDASQAYYQVVRQRLEQLRQKRIQGLQTFSEFLDARLAPAVNTCVTTSAREHDLAERAARLTALLRARVEVRLQEQNRSLLDSMDRRARLQLRLQETVEGLSVVAIGYYGVGLVAYMLKGAAQAGAPFDPVVGTAAAVPLVVGAAWIGLRRVRARLMKGGGHH